MGVREMKCYFALSDDVADNDAYYWMFVATLNSARKNTSLDLHCLYDFRKKTVENIEDDRIYKLLKEYSVTVHLTTIDFEEDLLSVYTDNYLQQINVTKSSLYSRFLRFMIADIETEDEYILYADTDVLFLKDIHLDDFVSLTSKENKSVPKTIGVCSEESNNYEYMNFNAGIMLINTSYYKQVKKTFLDWISHGRKARGECCDQGYLNEICERDFERVSNVFNWKPYWGVNSDAAIVHLHGVKPTVKEGQEGEFIPFVSKYMFDNPGAKDGWFHYFDLFATYTGNSKMNTIVLNNLTVTMNAQDPDYFSFKRRVFRKLGKILGIRK